MKKLYFLFLLSLLTTSNLIRAQELKPYILASKSLKNIEEVKSSIRESLLKQGFEILGEYRPANDANRWLFIVGCESLSKAVKETGGLAGFASAYHVALTRDERETIVSFTNPEYWGNAYFRDDYEKIRENIKVCLRKLRTACRSVGEYVGEEFGSEDGIEANDLKKYRYMLGMPRFDDTIILGEFDSYNDANRRIESNLEKGVENVTLVYSVEIPGEELKLYGFALSGEEGEEHFLPIVDISDPKHTAFLPYEFLVMGDEVHMLNGRYRIALSFPDLTMGTFTKIMSTPGDIEDLLESVLK
ncbi:hypothetical protein ACFLU5_08170 [Bacteroidota bacterium]